MNLPTRIGERERKPTMDQKLALCGAFGKPSSRFGVCEMRVPVPHPYEKVLSEANDGDVPPAVTCANCRRADCPGCERVPSVPPNAPLAWEAGAGSVRERLFRTALASSVDPERTFGDLPEGGLGSAFSFAFVAEALAIGSLGSLLALAALAAAPALFARVLGDPLGLALVGAAIVGLSVLMVALHALWGLCLELGARASGETPRFRHGLRFGLYACGWDLLTSPAGVVEGLLSRGVVRAWGPIAAAVRVPRIALRAYLVDCRKLGPRARRRGMQLSIAALGGAVLMMVIGLVVASVIFAERFFT